MENSDEQNARIEHDKALQRVLIELLTDHTELFRLFSDDPLFKKRLSDAVFMATYQNPEMNPHARTQSSEHKTDNIWLFRTSRDEAHI
jgi:hypothetical protein